jgi:hypothetical protein
MGYRQGSPREEKSATMFPLEHFHRQSDQFRAEAIRRAEHARLVKLVLDARRLFRQSPRQTEADNKR